MICFNRANSECAVFEDDSPIYYPTACCEIFHIKNAIYLANALQFFFTLLALFVYTWLDSNGFIQAAWLFRPTLLCSVIISTCGVLFAVVGGICTKTRFIQCQIAILLFLISLSDTCAICLVFTMAVGNRTELTAKMPAFLVSAEKFYDLLGPFWIYLLAIMLHIVAAILMCIMGVNKRYIEYLEDRNAFAKNYNARADISSDLHAVPATRSL